ncbi:MAG: helix-turn-helix transcriptional regulator [Deltaproteobacteria bacterium]|nr:helix-turn-helix transcriptional regulator [Deltaproteobacteria bacterium]
MIREIDLAFIKLHILYHAANEEVYGLGLIEELARHGYKLSPGTLYPTLAKMQQTGILTSTLKIVNHKQRKYYHITNSGLKQLNRLKVKIKELYKEVVEKK